MESEELLDWAMDLLRAAKVRIGMKGYDRYGSIYESWAERVDLLRIEVGLSKLEALANEGSSPTN